MSSKLQLTRKTEILGVHLYMCKSVNPWEKGKTSTIFEAKKHYEFFLQLQRAPRIEI